MAKDLSCSWLYEGIISFDSALIFIFCTVFHALHQKGKFKCLDKLLVIGDFICIVQINHLVNLPCRTALVRDPKSPFVVLLDLIRGTGAPNPSGMHGLHIWQNATKSRLPIMFILGYFALVNTFILIYFSY